MLAVWIHFLRKVLFLENLFFFLPLFFFLAFCNYSQCLWDFLFHCLHQVTRDVILDTNQKGENMTKYCLLQAHVFPCRGLCSGCPPEAGQRFSSSCSKRHNARCQPQARLLEALEIKMKGEKPVGIWRSSSWGLWFILKGTVKVAVCPSHFPALCNRDFMGTAACQSFSVLKKKESCKCDQLGDAVRLMLIPSSQWITSHWGEPSKSLPGEGTGCPSVTLPWWMRKSPPEARLELSWSRRTVPATSWQKCSTNIHSLTRVLFVSQESRRSGSCCFSKIQVRESDSALGTRL